MLILSSTRKYVFYNRQPCASMLSIDISGAVDPVKVPCLIEMKTKAKCCYLMDVRSEALQDYQREQSSRLFSTPALVCDSLEEPSQVRNVSHPQNWNLAGDFSMMRTSLTDSETQIAYYVWVTSGSGSVRSGTQWFIYLKSIVCNFWTHLWM